MTAKAKFAVSTVVGVVLALAMFMLVLAISHNNNMKWDLTKNKRYSLSEQSVKLVAEMKAPVEALAFLAESDEERRMQVGELLDNYESAGGGKFKYQIIDPLKRPSIAQQNDVKGPGTLVLKSGERTQRVMDLTEQDITNALLKLQDIKEKKLYFLTGHGERPTDNEPLSLGNFRRALAEEGFVAADLNLLTQKTVPTDAALLILAGPRRTMPAPEQDALKSYLKSGGRLLLLLDLQSKGEYDWLLKELHVQVPYEAVIGVSLGGSDPLFAASDKYSTSNPITRDLQEKNLATIFGPLARPVQPAEKPPTGVTVEWLVQSPELRVIPGSELGKTLDEAFKAATSGVRTLAVAGTYPASAAPAASPSPEQTPAAAPSPDAKANTKAVVVGDVGFMSNQFYELGGNRDLALNILNWLADSENRISIRPKDQDSQPLALQGPMRSQMWLLLVVAIPLAVLLAGFLTAFRRR